MTTYKIRPASVDDAATILRFIRELADYENALNEVAATQETVATSLFGYPEKMKYQAVETRELIERELLRR